MPKALIVIIPLLVVLFGALACDGDEDSGSPTSPSAGETVTAEPATRVPSSPAAEGTPTGDEPTPDGSPAVTEITPPDDVGEFLEQYAEEQTFAEHCTFDPDDVAVDCGEHGLYQPDPPPASENAECDILLVNDEPIAVRCSSQEPLTVTYYALAR